MTCRTGSRILSEEPRFLPSAIVVVERLYIFTGVCLSTGGRGTPPSLPGTHPPEQTPPWPGRHLPGQADIPLGRHPTGPTHAPLGRHSSWADTPLARQTPPRPGRHHPVRQINPGQTATAADGTQHPTGMHFCQAIRSQSITAVFSRRQLCILDIKYFMNNYTHGKILNIS